MTEDTATSQINLIAEGSSVYTVLFCDRLKQKPKFDGILTVSADHHVILQSSEMNLSNEQESSDQENSGHHVARKKAPYLKRRMESRPPSGVPLYTGKCPEISKKLKSLKTLEVDDIITLSKWQCQIISIDSYKCEQKSSEQEMKKISVVHQSIIARRADSLLKKPAIYPHKRKLFHGSKMDQSLNENQSIETNVGKIESTPNQTHQFEKATKYTTTFSGAIIPLEIPHSIKHSLRPHQVEGVQYLWNAITGSSPSLQALIRDRAQLDANESLAGAILGDEMGSGKTLMTIALLCGLFRRNRKKRFIVVCPSSLVSNWAKEFDRWLGKAQQPKRSVVLEGGESCLQKLRSFLPIKPHLSEILIISYDLFRINTDVINKASEIGLLVVDEGHRLKNSSAITMAALSSLQCDARLLITGTPIQNNLSEFYTLVNFVLPGLLGSSSEFRKVFERPIVAGADRNSTDEEKRSAETLLEELDRITSSFMIRRTGQEFLGSLLPSRTEIMIFCRLSDRQHSIYSSLTTSKFSDTGSDILGVVMQLRLLCNHPDLIDGKEAVPDSDLSLSGKMSVLKDLLESIRAQSPSDKVVIVSNFTSVLTFIERYILELFSWPYLRLDGQTDVRQRQSVVDSFNRGSAESSFAFLLSAKAGGCGLNLIGGNRLIMVEAEWNPAIDYQAMARITRLGQRKPCFVYRLFSKGTIEEVILQRQMQKQKLATITIDDKDLLCTLDSPSLEASEVNEICTLKDCDHCDTKDKFGPEWPDYDGVESIHRQGCHDKPLIEMITKNEHISYIHVISSTHNEKESYEGIDR